MDTQPPDKPQPSGLRIAGALLRALRPHQWVKNLFVAAPLLFSKNLLSLPHITRTTAAMVLYSFLSSAVYLINDLFDIEKDRIHPVKRHRPIASGVLPLPAARGAAAALLIVSLGLSFPLGLGFFAYAASYLILNLAYSLQLKNIPFVDVLCIATGFLLRVLAGAAVIDVVPSPWLLLCTFLLACFLGFGKRAHELMNSDDSAQAHARRPVLARYRRKTLLVMLWGIALLTCAAYVAYTVSPHTIHFFGTSALLYTAPFAVVGVLRFLQLVNRCTDADSPTEAMLKDAPFIVNLGLWVAMVVSTIYVI
jgi:decaprenyl-phosphate phosphoribosyltransferase